MSSRQQIRKASSLILAIALVLWAGAGVATVQTSNNSRQCRARMSHLYRATSAAMHAMSPGCCPGHVSSKPGCTSYPAAAPPRDYRPDCCDLSNLPARPRAFLIASHTPVELTAHTTAGPSLVSSPPRGGLWLGESPPFTKRVFDMKTDLRI